MAITITPKKVTGITIKGSGPIQGSTVNPQKTVASTALQNPVTVQTVQPAASGRVLQNASSVNAAQAAAIAAAAAEQAAAVAREVERQKEARRVELRTSISNKTETARTQIKTDVSRATVFKILTSNKRSNAKVITPEVSDEQKAKADAYWRAMAEYEKRTKTNKKGFFGFLDNNFVSRNIRESSARKFAEQQSEKVTKKGVSDYITATTKFQSEQAKRKAAIESSKFGSKDEYLKAVADYDSWQSSQISKLKRQAASLEGANDAYTSAASKPLSGAVAKSFAAVTKAVQGGGPLGWFWQHTLGEGDKNLPSLVTAPSRVLNFFGNLNTQDRNIYKSDGSAVKRSGGIADAWRATLGQRNANTKPWVDVKPGKQADAVLGAEVKSLIAARKRIGETDPAKLDYNKVMAERLVSYNRSHKLQNSGLEIASDPLNLAGGVAAASKKIGIGAKLAAGLQKTTAAQKIAEFTDTLKSTKIFKLATSESKTSSQALADAIDTAKKGTRAAQDRIFGEVNAINKSLAAAGAKLDVSVFDDFKSLDDFEAGVLQRMVDAKITARDRLKLFGPGMKPVRERLESIAAKWQDFTDQMKLVDNVSVSRFGRGKKMYFPRVDYSADHTLENYDFLKGKAKSKKFQTATDLRTNAIDRYFKSALDENFAATQSSKRAGLVARRKALLEQYDAEVTPLLENVRSADRRATGISKFTITKLRGGQNPISMRRAALNSIVDSRHIPMKIWKASVLKYRPAWYVNNIGYNVPAAALAGGSRALVEQARLLSPRYFRKALRDVPDEVKTNLANETGTGRLSRFASRVENVSRVGAFRALKKKGLSDDAALKRVNKYLFDYKTKNWERPFKAVIPFWSFQKNLTKAAAQMPFDRPAAAIGFNRLDQYQKKQYNDDFDRIVPKLKEAGYSADDIEKIRAENFKYFRGRIKIGGRYFNTPFNAFSEKGLSNMGVNPFLSALGETALSEDSFGRKLKGDDASFFSRIVSKFPQAQLAKTGKSKFEIATGRKKPSSVWIGAAGSEGYGMTKEAQGYDPAKPSYRKDLDKGAKFWEDLAAFSGVPRSSVFDTDQLLKRKVMQKLKEEYFATDWNSLDFSAAEKRRNELFTKYGVSRSDFYDGELARYDDTNTKRVKALKEEAYAKTKKLFAEYAAQPKGTRGVWATKKLKELTDSGYFDENPFLKSFDWLTPDTINKAYKKMAYDKAIATGDWTDYNRRFGDNRKHSKFQYAGKYFKTAESMAKYKSGEFWRKYAAADTVARRQLLRENPQYAKHDVKTEAEVAEAKFWAEYARASVEDRRKLLADYPVYNRRANWTKQQWDEWRVSNRLAFRQKVRSVSKIAENEKSNRVIAEANSSIFANMPKRTKKIKYFLQ